MDELLLFKGILWGSAALIIILVGSFIMFINFEREKIKSIEQRAKREIEFQREITLAVTETGEEIKSALARELHDNIGHSLALIRVAFEQFRVSEEWAENSLSDIDHLIELTTNDIRSISRTLNKDFIKSNDLITLIEIEIERLNRIQSSVNIKLYSRLARNSQYTSDQLLMAYRIFQEAITNALKHAEANHIAVGCWNEGSLLQICDDGKGFDMPSLKILNKNGLRNMQKRAELANLSIHIDSTLGKGTRVVIC